MNKSRRKKRLTWLFMIIAISLILARLDVLETIGYIYSTVVLEPKWEKAMPHTEIELERTLSFYSKHKIEPEESLWGNKYEMKEGESMVQYLILWRTPLDIVYDKDKNIVRFFRSYE